MNAPLLSINGLNVDVQPLAEGVYGIICEKGDEHIVAFGMIPLWAVELFERLLREKVIAEACKRLQVTPEEAQPYLDEKLIKTIVQKISQEVTTGIFAAAKSAGRLCV